MVSYPEHDKLKAIADKSQAIGEFLDWIQHDRGITLAEYPDEYDGRVLMPAYVSIDEWLALYFGIDRDKLEAEKRDMLDQQRRLNATLDT